MYGVRRSETITTRRCDMAKRLPLMLSEKDVAELTQITQRRIVGAAAVRRAQILLSYHAGRRVTEIAASLGTNRPLVERTLNRALVVGAMAALRDLPRSGRRVTIDDDAKSWVLALACQKPTALGYAQETWTYSLLIRHVRAHCQAANHGCLAQLNKGRLNAILAKGAVRPHNVSYYLERRDPDFEAKMANVLCVYKAVMLQERTDPPVPVATLSYDEKPGIQAIKTVGAELLPVPGVHPTRSRDHHYRRLGTVSLLAGIDLHNGRVIPLVRSRHRSREFIEFLSKVDVEYPASWLIRIVLDNHSAHLSAETQAYLRTKPGRFAFIFTPTHGSWLNLIEVFFSKLTRGLLRHIRVATRDELVERIYQGIDHLNQEPVIFRWRYRMDELQATSV